MQHFYLFFVPMISIFCFLIIEIIKRKLKIPDKVKSWYPLISGVIGGVLGLIIACFEPNNIFFDSYPGAILIGLIGGLAATGGNEVIERFRQSTNMLHMDDSPAKVYITGDKHRNFDRLIAFCKKNHLRKKDVIIILGDSGFNYYGDKRDDALKEKLAGLNVTLFCIHGNKENRPHHISTYGIQTFCNGRVYYEPKYPNLFFAVDGEIYRFLGKDYIAIGGAHSVDKIRCLQEGLPFWSDEMPGRETRELVEEKLANRQHQIDGFLTHTCPYSYLPTEMFISTKRNANSNKKNTQNVEYPLDIDRSTEYWLDKKIDKIRMMYQEITLLGLDKEEPI